MQGQDEEQMLLQKAIEESKREQVNPDQMSYEELLALSEKLGSVAKGFNKDQIEGMRTVMVSGYHHDLKARCCPVCHDNFKAGDIAKKLSCNHEYHDTCIDPWLEQEKNCPVCKQEVSLD